MRLEVELVPAYILYTRTPTHPYLNLPARSQLPPAMLESLSLAVSASLPHVFVRPLGPRDLPQCVALEQLAFPPNERATEQKIAYRLRVCPELTAGIFLRTFSFASNESSSSQLEDSEFSSQIDEDKFGPSKVITDEKLIAHIHATKIKSQTVTAETMDIPVLDSWGRKVSSSNIGHSEDGINVALHSLAVHPDYRNQSLGSLLLTDYIQRLSNLKVAAKIVIIAHEELVSYYTRLGFVDYGLSECNWGGVKWHDLAISLT